MSVIVRVYGCAIIEQHARSIVASLNKNGSADAVAAADAISAGLTANGTAGRLTPGMRDAILNVLHKPPSGLLGLHQALVNDKRARS